MVWLDTANYAGIQGKLPQDSEENNENNTDERDDFLEEEPTNVERDDDEDAVRSLFLFRANL